MDYTLGIITCSHKRQNILRLWCASIKRIRTDLDIDFPVVCVSDEADKSICESYNIHHITQTNIPVTAKFNRAMAWMRDQSVDSAIILGSDDICSSLTIKKIAKDIETGYDVVGINSICFYAADGHFKGQLCKVQASKILGVAKCISRRVLDEVNWRPWVTDRNWGMDAIVSKAILPHTKSFSTLRDTIVVDIKSRESLNKSTMWFNKIKDREPIEVFINILGEEEKQILKSL